MNNKVDLNFVCKVLSIFNGFDGPGSDSLFWRTDNKYAPVTLIVNCNDLFWWATADGETVTPENIHVLEQAVNDLKQVTKDGTYHEVDVLFCCRIRGMRPQGAYYKYIDKELWPLFNACGPEREVCFGNPYDVREG